MITASIPIAQRNWSRNYSSKKDMANYIKEQIDSDASTFVACQPDYLSTAILPFISHKIFYFPNEQRWGSYLIHDQQRTMNISYSNVVQNIADLPGFFKGYKNYFYLTLNEVPSDSINRYQIKLEKKSFDQYSGRQNTYYLYRLAVQ
jgi:hypothetical protein